MSAEGFIQQKAAEAIKALYGTEVAATSLQVSVTRKEFEGDYTLVTFPLLRITHISPDATGNAIGEWLLANVPEIAAFNSVKGFLNLSFSPVYWDETLLEIAQNADYGQLPPTGRRVMVEFSSPNTNKPLHLGHIRNNLLGDSVSRILKANGNEVIKATLVNDRGVHICKSMLAWQKCFEGKTPESTGIKGDHLVGDCYVAFSKLEKEHPEIIDEAHEMLVKWEQGDSEVRSLWEMMNSWVFAGFDQTYKALGISFDKVDRESETYLLGKELVRKGLESGVFEKEPDCGEGIICNLSYDGYMEVICPVTSDNWGKAHVKAGWVDQYAHMVTKLRISGISSFDPGTFSNLKNLREVSFMQEVHGNGLKEAFTGCNQICIIGGYDTDTSGSLSAYYVDPETGVLELCATRFAERFDIASNPFSSNYDDFF
ncbi:MAG: arginine--tRNA ligase, partial [Bacteroidales bacterium]|nr:arginine--tRNA ligase [Bacteroidales bacterium]